MLKVHNPEKYEKALLFRRRGFSYTEISKIVGVSKATVSNWFSKKAFSKQVRQDNEQKARRDNVKRLTVLNKARDKERTKHYQAAQRSARTEFKHFKATPLFLVSLGLYAASGDLNHPTQIRFPNQRIKTHKTFRRFLVEFLGVERSDVYNQRGVTILNDALSKQKLLAWIDLLP